MISLSLCMIVKNEQAVLQRCLDSANLVYDQLIVVDTGSNDNTKEIALKFTDEVFDFEWCDDFAKARNYAFSKASMDYIMWLDADDVILQDDANNLIQLKNTLSDKVDMVTMPYNVRFDEHGVLTLKSTRERIFRRTKQYQWLDCVHEYIQPQGNILHVDNIAITHKPGIKTCTDRNLKIYQNYLKTHSNLSPRGQYYYARELKDHNRLEESITWFCKFLDGKQGWQEDNIAACYNIALCYNKLDQKEKAYKALLRSFEHDAPRPEICCMIGYYFADKRDFSRAIAWYKTALTLPDKQSKGFVLTDYHIFVPSIMLAYCYDNTREYELANFYNNIAGKAKPNSKEYLHNKTYFKQKLPQLNSNTSNDLQQSNTT